MSRYIILLEYSKMQLSEILLQFNFSNFYVLLSSSILFILLFFVGRSFTGPKEIHAIQIPIGLFSVYVFFIIGSIFIDKFSTINVIIFMAIFSVIGIFRSLKYPNGNTADITGSQNPGTATHTDDITVAANSCIDGPFAAIHGNGNTVLVYHNGIHSTVAD